MPLKVSKRDGQCDFLARMFKVKSLTFERSIVRFIRILADSMHKLWVTVIHERFSVTCMFEINKFLKHHLFCSYLVDDMF